MAAHAQSNEGDVSPNTAGPICIDTGKPCDYKTSTCNGRVSLLVQLLACEMRCRQTSMVLIQIFVEQ